MPKLGWPEERILVFEEEQAHGPFTHSRQAYRELAEKVVGGTRGHHPCRRGLRWARDNVAWQLLLRDCIFAEVLLADEKKVYDANDPHDHVVLGIQGVLAEYELGLLRRRMQECWWKKANRAEMFTNIATGYVEVRGQGLAKHPDQRVQHSLERMFQKFEQMPSVMKLCQWYLDHEEPLPYVAHGDDPYHVQWLPANYSRLLWMLKNPAYAGAYVLGRTQTIVRRCEDGELVRRRHLVTPEQWEVVEKNRFAAYISWEQYEGNLAKIQGNATMKGEASRGAPRRGVALLAGCYVAAAVVGDWWCITIPREGRVSLPRRMARTRTTHPAIVAFRAAGRSALYAGASGSASPDSDGSVPTRRRGG